MVTIVTSKEELDAAIASKDLEIEGRGDFANKLRVVRKIKALGPFALAAMSNCYCGCALYRRCIVARGSPGIFGGCRGNFGEH